LNARRKGGQVACYACIGACLSGEEPGPATLEKEQAKKKAKRNTSARAAEIERDQINNMAFV